MSEHDRDIDDPKITALYRQLQDEAPAPDTDALIKAAARRAVGNGPRRHFSMPALSRLTATAAALLLGISLTLHWQLREPREFREATAMAPSPQTSAVAPAMSDDAVVQAEAEARREIAPKPRAPAKAAEKRKVQEAFATEPMAPAPPPAEEPAPALMKPAAPPASDNVAAEALQDAETRRAEADRAAAEREMFSADALTARPQLQSPATMAREQQSEYAAPAAAAASDYRELMVQGAYDAALAAAQRVDSPTAQVDRDLLGRLLGNTAAPDCSRLPVATLGQDRLLCDLLLQASQATPLPGDWLTRLREAGLITGEKSYRRHAVEAALNPSRD